MIFDWMENDTLLRTDQVLNVIYELRMCTKRQLLAVTGLQLENLNVILGKIRRLPGDEQDDWLVTKGIRRPRKKGESIYVYSLGRKAIQHVQNMRGLEVRAREAPSAQMGHFVGINSILENAIMKFGKERIKWFSELELADLLFLQMRENSNQEPQRRSVLRPDGQIIINDRPYFVEFDNSTEGARQLENKFARYVEIYEMLDIKHPILWVANTDKRIDYLERNWKASMENFYSHRSNLPECIFTTSGSEWDFIKKERVQLPASFA
ncbi:replication-relaxation family protein [Bacillus subtilis]|uniref:replication-relaxation family protein n=1 Tax=Bacillus subtilis TaxID=1423 RepID=UPI003F7CA6FB